MQAVHLRFEFAHLRFEYSFVVFKLCDERGFKLRGFLGVVASFIQRGFAFLSHVVFAREDCQLKFAQAAHVIIVFAREFGLLRQRQKLPFEFSRNIEYSK